MHDLWNPSHALSALPHVRVVADPTMPDDFLGASSTRASTIWLNTSRVRSEAERRCTLAHELIHLSMGHEGHQPPGIERLVSDRAAALLITRTALQDALRWSSDVFELAELLTVTPTVLRDRIELPDTRALIERAQFQEWP